MKISINYQDSYQRGEYIVLNVTLENNSEDEVLCVCSLTGAQIRQYETRKIIESKRIPGAGILPYSVDGAKHSFGAKPFLLSSNETKTDNLVFLVMNSSIQRRVLSIVDSKKGNEEVGNITIEVENLTRK